jgi:hypothetical protein
MQDRLRSTIENMGFKKPFFVTRIPDVKQRSSDGDGIPIERDNDLFTSTLCLHSILDIFLIYRLTILSIITWIQWPQGIGQQTITISKCPGILLMTIYTTTETRNSTRDDEARNSERDRSVIIDMLQQNGALHWKGLRPCGLVADSTYFFQQAIDSS